MMGCDCIFFILGIALHEAAVDDFQFYQPPVMSAPAKLKQPLGRIELGYEFANGVELSIEHTSQIAVTDYGLNALWLKKRWNLPRDTGE